MVIKDLNDIPPIRKYLKRIGAEPRSFNKAVIKEHMGKYWRDTHVISFQKDGTVEVEKHLLHQEDNEAEPASLLPGDQEQEEIKNNWHLVPRYTPALNLNDLPTHIQDSNLYVFWNISGTEILMIQSRMELKDGGKQYIPWTLWSDGKWRPLEPNDKLPLYNLPEIKNHTTVFIHEGAKAAHACKEIAENGKDHPWKQELSGAAHIGWIGGALNPHRTDWSLLRKHGIQYAYIVADNDPEGMRAISAISKQLFCITFSIEFNDQFPQGFDLADPFPKSLFRTVENQQVYKGPKFHTVKHPATWMTDVKSQGKGRPRIQLRKHISKLWSYVESTEQIVCLHMPDILMRESVANKHFLPYSDSSNTARLIQKNRMGRSVDLAYRPDIDGIRVGSKEKTSINVYTQPRVASLRGSPTMFLDFLQFLIKDPVECHEILKWCATMIARPEVRMGYGLLLFSRKHGVGKTTLAECILAPLVGWDNVSFPSEMTFQSSFNEWAVHKRLVVVNEIYQGKSWKIYNMLKSVMTDRSIQVNIKHIPGYTIDNWCHVFACSNSSHALKIDNEDRRWFIPEVTEQLWERQKYRQLREWLNSGGLNIIKHWAENFGDYVKPSEHAPMTNSKQEMIEDSQTPFTIAAENAILQCREDNKVIPATDLYEYLCREVRKKGMDNWETIGALKFLLRSLGWIKITPSDNLGLKRRERFNNRLQQLFVRKSFLEKSLKEVKTKKDLFGVLNDSLWKDDFM